MSATLDRTFNIAPVPEPDSVPAEVATHKKSPEDVIADGQAELNAVIAAGLLAIKQSFEKAKDWEAGQQNKAREVGAMLMQATVNAIRQKQAVATVQLGLGGGGADEKKAGMDRNAVIDMIRARTAKIKDLG